MQGAGDGCGGHGEDVDVGAHLFEAFFVADAEALLFIDYEEAEILELEVLLQDGVCADEDVDLTFGGFFEDELFLLGGAEAGDHLDVDGEVGEAALEGFEVLEGEDCGGG